MEFAIDQQLVREQHMDLKKLSIKALLQTQANIILELKEREVVRTKNNPIGDFTEWLVAQAYGLELANNSKTGYDAIDAAGSKIQIKGRRVTADNPSRQLSAIRKYEEKDFDELIAVIFDEDFEIDLAVRMPHAVIGDYSRFSKHSNAHILLLKGDILKDARVQHITHHLQNVDF